MMMPSTAVGGSPEVALVGQYDASGNIDEVRAFDVVAGAFVASTPFDIDLLQTSLGGDGRCNIDNISIEEGVDPQGADEMWWSCAIPTVGLQQTLTTDFNNNVQAVSGAAGADLILRLGPDRDNTNITQRRVFAARGTATLIVEQVTQNIASRPTLKERDDVNVIFGKIAGLSLITQTDNSTYGDIVLVFDRAYPSLSGKPALVPVERQNTEEGPSDAWELARAPWRVIELPANTHAVRLVGAVPVPNPDQLNIDNTQQTAVNVEVYLPVEGRVAFARLETEMTSNTGALDPDNTGFPSLDFEPEAGDRPTAVPPVDERILIEPVPGESDTVFYVTTNAAFGWRLKLRRNSNDADFVNDVEGAQFVNDFSDRPSAMVTIPNVSDTVWISLSNIAELHPISFNLGN